MIIILDGAERIYMQHFEYFEFNRLPPGVQNIIIEYACTHGNRIPNTRPIAETSKNLDHLDIQRMKEMLTTNKKFGEIIKRFKTIHDQKKIIINIPRLVETFLQHYENKHDKELQLYLEYFTFLTKPIANLNRFSYVTEPDQITNYLKAAIKNAKTFYLIAQDVFHKKRIGSHSENSKQNKQINYVYYTFEKNAICEQNIGESILLAAQEQFKKINFDHQHFENQEDENSTSQHRIEFLAELLYEINSFYPIQNENYVTRAKSINWEINHSWWALALGSAMTFVFGTIAYGFSTTGLSGPCQFETIPDNINTKSVKFSIKHCAWMMKHNIQIPSNLTYDQLKDVNYTVSNHIKLQYMGLSLFATSLGALATALYWNHKYKKSLSLHKKILTENLFLEDEIVNKSDKDSFVLEEDEDYAPRELHPLLGDKEEKKVKSIFSFFKPVKNDIPLQDVLIYQNGKGKEEIDEENDSDGILKKLSRNIF